MQGPNIIARTLSVAQPFGASGRMWNYHSRSDRHSKVGVWAVLFDFLLNCPLLRQHVAANKVAFGINHEIRDFQQNRKKDLDLVVCTPRGELNRGFNFADLAHNYSVQLNGQEIELLASIPAFFRADVGSVLVALEAKACMTEHLKARPRLYDELNSSHLTIHGADGHTIAGGLAMINAATRFASPIKNEKPGAIIYNNHSQPRATEKVIEKITELPRRSSIGMPGFDAMGIVVIKCENDGSPVVLVQAAPAPASRDIYHYDTMIHRLSSAYSSRFGTL